MKWVCLLLLTTVAHAQDVVVRVSKVINGGEIKIEYTVENNTEYPVSVIRIGFVDTVEQPCPLLDKVPVRLENPNNWHSSVLDEKNPNSVCDKYFIEWRGDDPSASSQTYNEILPHTKLGGFIAVLNEDLSCYYINKFNVFLEKAGDGYYRGDLILNPITPIVKNKKNSYALKHGSKSIKKTK